MKKKILLTLILILFGILVLGTFSVSAATYGNLTYEISNGEVTITDCKTTVTTVTIPNQISGYPVTCIGNSAFRAITSLTSVAIPESVTTIGTSAFMGCTRLISINLPNSLTQIGGSAFNGCTKLASINIPESVNTIGASAFMDCTELTSINLPENLAQIGGALFCGCTKLTSVNIPENVTVIGSQAFDGCTVLTSINIPKDVTTIGEYAFRDCKGITSIYWDAKSVDDFDTDNYIFYRAGRYADGISVVFSDNVEKIPDSVFYPRSKSSYEPDAVYAPKIRNVTIGKNVTVIGKYAFMYCKELNTITIPNGVTSIKQSTFEGCANLKNVTIPDSVTDIVGRTFVDCINLTSITIPDSVTHIGGSSFNGCYRLTSINIPENIKKIETHTFYGCSSLANITIPDSVTSIESNAFYGCAKLTSVNIPENVTTIGNYAFKNCSLLKLVSVPKSVVSIGCGAFEGCSSMEEITLPFIGSARGNSGTLDSVFGYIFGYTTSSSNTSDIKQNYTYEDYSYFHIPSTIKKVTITDETVVGYGAFCGCNNILDIVIDSNVKAIGSRAFAYHYNLLNVTIKSTSPKFADSLVFYETDFATLYGYPGSTVEEYAIKNGIDFESLVISGHCEIDGSIKAINSTLVVSVDLNAIVTDECLHIALYTDNGQMVDYIIVPSDKPFNTMNVVFKDNKDSSYAKVFLWNGVTSMQPLTEAKKIDIVR